MIQSHTTRAGVADNQGPKVNSHSSISMVSAKERFAFFTKHSKTTKTVLPGLHTKTVALRCLFWQKTLRPSRPRGLGWPDCWADKTPISLSVPLSEEATFRNHYEEANRVRGNKSTPHHPLPFKASWPCNNRESRGREREMERRGRWDGGEMGH